MYLKGSKIGLRFIHQVDLGVIIGPGAKSEVADMLIPWPPLQVEDAEGDEAGRGHPEHGPVWPHDKVRVVVLVGVAGGAVVLNDVGLPDLVVGHVEDLHASIVRGVPDEFVVVPPLQKYTH